MEAGSRHQLDLDGAVQGTVRAIDGRLVIESLTIEDERTARIVRERAQAGAQPAETVRKTIEIGARVLDSEETAANVDYVRREVQSSLGELNKELSSTLADGNSELAERIAQAFGADRSGSVQQQIKQIIDGATERHRHEITKLLSADDGSNPLIAIQTRMGKAIVESDERHRQEMARLRETHVEAERAMRQQVGAMGERVAELVKQHEGDERVAEAEEAGTRKGFSFEEKVHLALERIASARGDCASHTGGEIAEGGGKKGDTLIELGAAEGPSAGRILFEAKDRRLSMNQAWTELNEGMAARAAAFAVLVVAGEERMPARTHSLHEYEGNKMIVPLDREEPDGLGLEVAYRLAAARVAMARDRELQIDALAVRDTAEEAISLLKQAQAIRTSLTGIKTSSDRARAGLDAMVESVRSRLERVEALIGETEPE